VLLRHHAPILRGEETAGTKTDVATAEPATAAAAAATAAATDYNSATATTRGGHGRARGRRVLRFTIRHRVTATVHRSHVGETLQASGIRHHVQTQR